MCVAVQELHKDEDSIDSVHSIAKRNGMHGTVTAASPSAGGGNCGGCATLSSKAIGCRGVAPELQRFLSSRLCAAVVNAVTPGGFVLISIYLHTGKALTQRRTLSF